MLEKSLVYQKAYKLSLDIINLHKNYSNKEVIDLFRQLLRCGTSIGANISEANGAISKEEFACKLSIAYKEAIETRYWISLLKDSKYLNKDIALQVEIIEAEEICKMIFSILKNTGRIRKH